MAASEQNGSKEKSFLDLITNMKFGEEEQGTMQQLEERTRRLEKRVENLEAIVENMEISRDDDICDNKRQRKGSSDVCSFVEDRDTLTENDKDTLLPPERLTAKSFPDEQIKSLRVMFESVEDLLRSPDYDEYLQAELSSACPNYMTVFQTAKRDLLRNDCGVILAGETSAGKTTLINQLVGSKVFVTGNLATTGTITRIRNSEKMAVKCYLKDETLIKEEEAQDVKQLRALIKGLTDIRKIPEDLKDVYYVDVYLPVSILKGNVIVVDTPGIGENDKLDQMLLDLLPHAVSFVFVINAKNAGGIHEDRLSKIFKTIMDNREKMPCFDPREVLFLTNQWDIIYNDSSSDEDDDETSEKKDEHKLTWELIHRKLENGWGWLEAENVFRVSLKQVGKGFNNFFTDEYERFQTALKTTIDKNKDARVEFYYRFLKDFMRNAARGTLTRLNALDRSEEGQKFIIKQNTAKIQELQIKCKKLSRDLESYKTTTIDKLTDKLYDYLRSEEGRKEMLNPPGIREMCEVKYKSIWQEVPSRIRCGIKRWCKRPEAKSIIEHADAKLRSFVRDMKSEIQEIEIDMTGQNTGYEFSLTRTTIALGLLLLPLTIVVALGYAVGYALIFTPITEIRSFFVSSEVHSKMVNIIYDACLKQISKCELKKCFEKSFGVEYGKLIVNIFDESLPNILESLLVTNRRLLNEYEDIRQQQDFYRRLKERIQKIRLATEHFEKTYKFVCN